MLALSVQTRWGLVLSVRTRWGLVLSVWARWGLVLSVWTRWGFLVHEHSWRRTAQGGNTSGVARIAICVTSASASHSSFSCFQLLHFFFRRLLQHFT